MRTIVLSKNHENYLCKTADEIKPTFGILIGQKTSDDKYYIIHVAKLSEDEESLVNLAEDTASPFENVDVQALADQWMCASKMIPGSFSVIGIFAASVDNDLSSEKHPKSIKRLLGELYKLLTASFSSTFGYAERARDLEIIFLSYLTSSLNVSCKIFSGSVSSGNMMPVDCKIVDKLPQWYLFESNYELDDVYPITDNREKINIENQFNAALEAVKLNINNSEIFIQHQNVDDSITLENYIKENSKKNDIPVFRASIFLTANVSNEYLIKIRSFNGTIRFSGIVSSRVWCHPKNTFEEIKESIRSDVLRSMAARIQIYCDGLTDLHSNNVGVVVSEPPRRIYFCHSESQGIQFSEYIFRGETPSVAVAQAKQILDMDINSDCIFDDLEGLPDDEALLISEEQPGPNPKVNPGPEISRAMYMLGIAAALLVLLLSVLLHYLFL